VKNHNTTWEKQQEKNNTTNARKAITPRKNNNSTNARKAATPHYMSKKKNNKTN
jgi:hypothetical protein